MQTIQDTEVTDRASQRGLRGMNKIQNYIDGRWIDPTGGKFGRCSNPANRDEVLAEVAESQVVDVETAIFATAKAFAEWSRLPMPKRANWVAQLIDRMRLKEAEFTRTITAENGKTLRESRVEFQAAIKEADYQLGQARRYAGDLKASEMPGVTCYLLRQPLGVVTLITPWNFPLNVACRKMLPALLAGNCCVLKPSEMTPMSAALLFSLLHECNFPAGVANLVLGRGSVIGNALTTNPAVKAISFTGSTVVGLGIAETVGGRDVGLQLEMGGKNPLVVLADANLDAAVEAAVIGGFSCSGQWCTSTSRVIVEAPVYDLFVERLAKAAKHIVVGDGADENSRMGPVCGRKQFETVRQFIATGIREGARLCAGGEDLAHGELAKGYFVLPTVFADVTPEMVIAREEIFGPVISVMKARDFDDALSLANATCYGLASSVYTNDLALAQRFVVESEVGLTHVNMPTAYKEPQLEFGGVRESGRGLPEAGECGIEFFTRHKAVYMKERP